MEGAGLADVTPKPIATLRSVNPGLLLSDMTQEPER